MNTCSRRRKNNTKRRKEYVEGEVKEDTEIVPSKAELGLKRRTKKKGEEEEEAKEEVD